MPIWKILYGQYGKGLKGYIYTYMKKIFFEFFFSRLDNLKNLCYTLTEMKRYHKKVYFPFPEKIEAFNNRLNALDFSYSKHSLDNLRYRAIDMEGVLRFIAGAELKAEDIFEYYLNEYNEIEKACYRIQYNSGIDLILVLNYNKRIVTIYCNRANDNHYTLNKTLYTIG